jgi:hypothetical protein
MATLEQILEDARALSPEERRRLREALDREEATAQSTLIGSSSSRALERKWIVEHRDEFLGQWVALDGDHRIANGNDARDVYTSAREAGIAVPFVVRIENNDEPSMGGWQ